MKKWITAALAAMVLLLLPALGLAQEAADLTADCKVSSSAGKYKITRVYDRQYKTYWVSDKAKNTYIELDAKGGEQIHGVYVCFWDKLTDWELKVRVNGNWQLYGEYSARYAHEFIELDRGYEAVRVCGTSKKSATLSVNEIYVFGEGEVPSWVQRWQDAPEKVDLLLLAAHPDDELLFFGGALPTYAGEQGKDVLVCYMTCNTFERRSELLDGLWACGVTLYPNIGDMWDKYSKKLDTAYEAWGKTTTWKYVTALLRRYQPDVVLTHDQNGEYGHGAHRACLDALKRCVEYAADPEKYTESVSEYGTWQVKKLYSHLYAEAPIEMDWDQPLQAFGGKTGYEVAAEAYTHHISQQNAGQKNAQGVFEVFVVEPRESDYSCYRFGLVYTAVGADEAKNDFFEHID